MCFILAYWVVRSVYLIVLSIVFFAAVVCVFVAHIVRAYSICLKYLYHIVKLWLFNVSVVFVFVWSSFHEIVINLILRIGCILLPLPYNIIIELILKSYTLKWQYCVLVLWLKVHVSTVYCYGKGQYNWPLDCWPLGLSVLVAFHV